MAFSFTRQKGCFGLEFFLWEQKINVKCAISMLSVERYQYEMIWKQLLKRIYSSTNCLKEIENMIEWTWFPLTTHSYLHQWRKQPNYKIRMPNICRQISLTVMLYLVDVMRNFCNLKVDLQQMYLNALSSGKILSKVMKSLQISLIVTPPHSEL